MRLPAYLTEKPRFFGGKKWVFWYIALLPGVALLLLHPCLKNGIWPVPLFFTIMVMACLWEAHVQAMRLGLENRGMRLLWQVGKRALRTLLSVAIAGLLPFLSSAILLPSYSCYGDRARVSVAMAFASEVKSEITHRASVAKTLKGAGLGLALPKYSGNPAFNGFVLEDGVIILIVEEPPAAVRFTPKLVDANSGAIEWSCRGYPAKSVPTMCREPE